MTSEKQHAFDVDVQEKLYCSERCGFQREVEANCTDYGDAGESSSPSFPDGHDMEACEERTQQKKYFPGCGSQDMKMSF